MKNIKLLRYISTLTQISIVTGLELITQYTLILFFFYESWNSFIFLLYIYMSFTTATYHSVQSILSSL
jgi:hypothetical protein